MRADARGAGAARRVPNVESFSMARFALLVAFLWLGCAVAQQPEQLVRVKGEREGRGAVVRAFNDSPIPVSVVVTFTEIDNLQASERVPFVTVVPANSTLDVMRMNPLDLKKSWSYRLRFRYRWGSYDAAHDPAAMYRMPWLDGRTFTIGQAPGGPVFTHFNPSSREAVDIPMPEGTPILAARAGIVFQTV